MRCARTGRLTMTPECRNLTPGLRSEQRLDGAALVHGAVALRHLRERQREVEDLPGFDRPVPDEVDELRQEAAHRGGAAVQPDMPVEEVLEVDDGTVRQPDE